MTFADVTAIDKMESDVANKKNAPKLGKIAEADEEGAEDEANAQRPA